MAVLIFYKFLGRKECLYSSAPTHIGGAAAASAAAPGTQRVGPIWTGDNAAQWSHMAVSVPMVLTLNLAGLPF